MRSSIIYGLCAAVITWLFMYLDTRLLDNPKTKATYIKNMTFVGCLVGFGIVLLGEHRFDQIIGIDGGQIGSGFIHGINEEIMTGMPNF